MILTQTRATQVENTTNYNDGYANPNDVLTAEPPINEGYSLEHDLNVLRSLIRQLKGATNWFDSPTNTLSNLDNGTGLTGGATPYYVNHSNFSNYSSLTTALSAIDGYLGDIKSGFGVATTTQVQSASTVRDLILALDGYVSNLGSVLATKVNRSGDTLTGSLTVTNGQLGASSYTIANSGSTATIDWNNGNLQAITLTANCILTFTNPIPGFTYTLLVVQDNVGSRLVTWPNSISWHGAVAPTLLTTAGGVDLFTFQWDGTNYYTESGQYLGATGNASTPSYSFTNDSNTGIYNSSADSLSITTNGLVRKTVSTTSETATLPQLGRDGSAAAPTYSFANDSNIGMYRAGADTLGFSTAGTIKMSISPQGVITTTALVPTTGVSLNINGKLAIYDTTKSRNAGLTSEASATVLTLGINDDTSNRFGGNYTYQDQGGFFRLDSRAGQPLVSIWCRNAGVQGAVSLLMSLATDGTLMLGRGDGATPSAVNIKGPSATGTNIAGANVTIDASNGTGTGGSGNIIFRTAPVGSSGAVANTLAAALTIGNSTITGALPVVLSKQLATTTISNSTSGSAKTINWDSSNTQTITLSANCTFTYSNARSGASYTLVVTQDNTGGWNITWPSGTKWPSGTPVAASTTANAISVFQIRYDGTNYYTTAYGQDFA